MGIFKKKSKVGEMIDNYLNQAVECMDNFIEAVNIYFEKGLSREFNEAIEKTHISESLADDLRRELEMSLYERSLIPESRGDMLGLVESTDEVLNKAQSVLYQIETEFLEIPVFLKDDFLALVDINVKAFKTVVEGFRVLFTDIKKVKGIANEIDKKESLSDRYERGMIRKIFSSDIEMCNKLLIKEVVIETGNISDFAQVVSDRLTIVSAKRVI
jgi:uncharacterized protein